MKTTIQAMNEEAFEKYLKSAIPFFAKINIESGRWDEVDAIERAQKYHDFEFPDGINTKNTYFFDIKENLNHETVGFLIASTNANFGFIYDFEIYEPYRRKGYAKSALENIEIFLYDLGVTVMELEVFDDNESAKNLYSNSGYNILSNWMRKTLKPASV